MRKLQFLLWLLVSAILTISTPGCSDDSVVDYGPGPVGDIYRACFVSGDDCDKYRYELFMHLSAVSGPNPDYSYPYLRLGTTSGAGGAFDRIGFDYYEYGELPSDSGYPGTGQYGWKVHVPEAYISFCTTCYTEGGLANRISLFGPREIVEFFWDPEDTLSVYWDRALIE